MSIEKNKELIRQAWKEWSAFKGDVSRVRPWYEKYCAPSFTFHDLSRGDMNREQRIESVAMTVSAFPDYSMSVDAVIAEGDMVVTRYALQGTHNGTFRGIPATGKRFVAKGVIICKMEEARLLEIWDFPDSLGIMTQLGVIPSPGAK